MKDTWPVVGALLAYVLAQWSSSGWPLWLGATLLLVSVIGAIYNIVDAERTFKRQRQEYDNWLKGKLNGK
jgi:hypothetical protein